MTNLNLFYSFLLNKSKGSQTRTHLLLLVKKNKITNNVSIITKKEKKSKQTTKYKQTKQLELLKQIVIKKIWKSWQILFTSSYYNGLLTCVMESHPLHLTVMAVTKSSQYMRLVCEKDKGEINKSGCALQLSNSCINCAYIIKQSQLSSQKLIYLFAFSFCQHK